MTRVVTLEEFTPGARTDGIPWTQARLEESATPSGTFTALQTYTFGTGGQPGPDADPRAPQARDFTTTLATLDQGYYRIVFLDTAGHEQPVGPIFVSQTAQGYTSVDALRRVLAPDGDQSTSTAASLSDDELESAIAEATSEIDARLAARYTLPFQEVPWIVGTLARDIAAFLATLTHRGADPIDANDPVQKRYDRAQALLTQVQAGKIDLQAGTGDVPQSADPVVINPYDGDLFALRDFSLVPRVGGGWGDGWEELP